MDFAQVIGRKCSPINRGLKPRKMDDKSLQVKLVGREEYGLLSLLVIFRVTYNSKHFSQHLRCSSICRCNWYVLFLIVYSRQEFLRNLFCLRGKSWMSSNQNTSNAIAVFCLSQINRPGPPDFLFVLMMNAPSELAMTRSFRRVVLLSGRRHAKEVGSVLRISE